MEKYSPFVSRFVRSDDDTLRVLVPKEASDPVAVREIREASDEELAGDAGIKDALIFPLVRAGLLYRCDAIDESHRIIQDVSGDLGAYWHGMIHRREGDFDNARYWFRRSGALPVFSQLHAVTSELSRDMAKQRDWDPYLFVGQCEQQRFGANEEERALVAMQRAEFFVLFGYSWRQSVETSN